MSFYHNFLPGFNFWYVALPLFIILAAVIGYYKYGLENDRVFHRYVDRFLKITSGTMAVIFGAMYIVESGIGIIQLSLNAASEEGAIIFPTLILLLLPPVLVYFVLFFLMKTVSEWRRKRLHEQISLW